MSASRATRIEKLAGNMTANMITAAELLAANRFLPKEERLTIGAIAEAAAISDKQFYNWRTKNSDFIEYVNIRAIQAFNAHLPDVMEKHLAMTVGGQGSMKGIELFYKFGGYLVDKTEDVTGSEGSDRAALEERLAKLRARKEESDI